MQVTSMAGGHWFYKADGVGDLDFFFDLVFNPRNGL
jgi:hypothetical protein